MAAYTQFGYSYPSASQVNYLLYYVYLSTFKMQNNGLFRTLLHS